MLVQFALLRCTLCQCKNFFAECCGGLCKGCHTKCKRKFTCVELIQKIKNGHISEKVKGEYDWQNQGNLTEPFITHLADIGKGGAAYYNLMLKENHPDRVDENWTQWGQLCLLYTSPSPRDRTRSRMPSSA